MRRHLRPHAFFFQERLEQLFVLLNEHIALLHGDFFGELGIGQLPQSLAEALSVMEGSSLVHEALGEHIFEWFLRNKRHEWRAYKTHVTAFEHDRYLTTL